jgi:hypothetical protein
MARSSIFPVLYSLAARAPRMTADVFRARLTTSLANHYDALSCALHTDATGSPAAAADPVPEVEALPRLDRARIETIEARLVRYVVEHGTISSALNLEDGSDVDAFLSSRLGVYDIFAFPLKADDAPFAVLVLYLGEDSQHLGEEDLQALCSLGHLFPLVGTALVN